MNLRDLLDREQDFWTWAKGRHNEDAVELAKEFLKMSKDDDQNARAQQAAAMATARGVGIGLAQQQMQDQMNRYQGMQQAAQGACRGIGGTLNGDAVWPNEQQAYTGLERALAEAVERENEACAVLAESHGFPELARYIRMRVSTSALPEKK